MIDCLAPVTLRSGLVVGCGKCVNCLSKRRNEWSVRMQLHQYGYTVMPLFVTLTYNDSHLPRELNTFKPVLFKRHLQLFIKKLKDRFNLYNTDFSYLCCGEYGSDDFTERPHYHGIFYGLNEVSDLWEQDVRKAERLMSDIWQYGFVDVKRAEWSGIHYVTKYINKIKEFEDDDWLCSPFLLASHGISLPWLFTSDAVALKDTFCIDAYRQRLRDMRLELDFTDLESAYYSVSLIVKYLEPFVPRMRCRLPSGKYAPLPRYLRNKLFGSFEVHTSNPFWTYEYYRCIRDSCDYLRVNADYDANNSTTMAHQLAQLKANKIISYLNQKLK